VRAPGNVPNYLQLAWALLFMAYCISRLAHRSARLTAPLLISSILALAAADLWAAAQTPADWTHYPFPAALLLSVVWALAVRWTRTRRA
jgi:lipopolysaccharide export LptBFGC system permease protein LptF